MFDSNQKIDSVAIIDDVVTPGQTINFHFQLISIKSRIDFFFGLVLVLSLFFVTFTVTFFFIENKSSTHFSSPRNASASTTLILFSYRVSISSVSSPSNARLCI